MVTARVTHPDAETTHVRVLLANSHDASALGEALDALVTVTTDLKRLIANPQPLAKQSKYAWYLTSTFHTPKRTFLRERSFFARCAGHPELHPAMATYARNVNSRKRGIRGMETDLGHSDMRPAGCFAYVPLALRDPKYIELFIESMWGTDMDHETFHGSFIEELLARHGLRAETMRLLAFRAVEAAGQDGNRNLKLAYEGHGLREKLSARGGLEAFAKLVDDVSERVAGPGRPGDGAPRHYRELYVANAGKALFQRDPEKLTRWLDFFRKRGLKLSAADAKPEATRDATPFRPFATEWREDD